MNDVEKLDMISARIRNIRHRIEHAATACGRDPKSVKLVAVTKTVPVDRIIPAIHAGLTCFGENYIQEAAEKIEALSGQAVSWHFIGHLQSNKAKYAVRYFDLIHSVDSLKLAKEIDRQAEKRDKIQRILIQVNVGAEMSKSGAAIEETIELVEKISHLENLSIRGLMTLPPYFDDPERAKPFFQSLAHLKYRIDEAGFDNVAMEELSMGMSGDFEAAIEEGATLVRIGTAIFGARQ